jgi:hypothetical protein
MNHYFTRYIDRKQHTREGSALRTRGRVARERKREEYAYLKARKCTFFKSSCHARKGL